MIIHTKAEQRRDAPPRGGQNRMPMDKRLGVDKDPSYLTGRTEGKSKIPTDR